jgi:acyl-CoA thioesterase
MVDVKAMFAADSAAQAAGMELLDHGPGSARTAMAIGAEHVNGHEGAHGAVIFLLADVAFAMACNSHGPVTVGRSAQIEYLRPAARGDRLEAVATERMRNGRNGIYDVSVTRPSDGALIAEFRGNSRELPSSR